MNTKDRLVWIDLEMTGLDAQKDLILEFAMIITDNDLNVVAPKAHYVIHQSQAGLSTMDAWVREHHTKSGLIGQVSQATMSVDAVEQEALALLREHCSPKKAPLCGNSIWQDAIFLRRYMPQLMDFLHYRIVDVSSIKEVIKRWYPKNKEAHFTKSDTHRALQDIEESIAELAWYRKKFFVSQE